MSADLALLSSLGDRSDEHALTSGAILGELEEDGNIPNQDLSSI